MAAVIGNDKGKCINKWNFRTWRNQQEFFLQKIVTLENSTRNMNSPVADGVAIANSMEFAVDFADAATYFDCQSTAATVNEAFYN